MEKLILGNIPIHGVKVNSFFRMIVQHRFPILILHITQDLGKADPEKLVQGT
jgi:hypothetical protein